VEDGDEWLFFEESECCVGGAEDVELQLGGDGAVRLVEQNVDGEAEEIFKNCSDG
jgi:hypothetical protein